MICSWVKRFLVDIENGCFTASSIRSKRKLVQTISCILEGKWPHHCCNIIRPMSFCMQEKSMQDEHQFFDSLFYNSILMVGAHSTESNCLASFLDCLLKARVCKSTIVCLVRMDSYTSFACMPFKSCLCK
jgi:hypothetical protein